jgi:hypothetical protein
MANEEHLAILRQGVEVWNEWRLKHPEISPDLASSDLCFQDLSGINFTRTNLREANLYRVKLANANLTFATLLSSNLCQADLREAKFHRSYLAFARLNGAKLWRADLNHAWLGNSDISYAILSEASLRDANLSGCRATATIFSGADLTGSYLKSWNPDDANFDEVTCDFVYLKSREQRFPAERDFISGEFSKLFQATRSYSKLAVLDQLINRFEKLLNDFPEGNESIFHDFLKENPVLLDIYVSQNDIVSKPRFYYPLNESPLGKEYVEPDFIIKEAENKYKLVELEKPEKNIATKQGQSTSGVSQAAFQIAEWDAYICNHYDCIKERFPGISIHRSRMIVIGRGNEKSIGAGRDAKKYMEILSKQYSCEKVCTYDDLLDKAKKAHAALIALSV